MKSYVIFLFSSFILLLPVSLLAQELPEVIPPSPEAASLGKFTEVPISHYTGVPNISMPITSISLDGKTIPVSFNYHARGVQVSEIASRVGLGWTLNGGGSITRQVRHKPDDGANGFTSTSFFSGPLATGSFFSNQSVRDNYANSLTGVSEEIWDRLPDNFIVQATGLSAKFVHDYTDGQPLVQQFEDNKIETLYGNNLADQISNKITGFIVTDKDGFKYYFGISEDGLRRAADFEQQIRSLNINWGGYTVLPGSDDAYYYNTWHLMDIKSPSGHIVSFNYLKEQPKYYRRSYDRTEGPTTNSYNISSEVIHHQWQLESIEYRDETIAFVKEETSREDLNLAYALDKVEVYYDGVLNKTFDLQHRYQNTVANDINYTNYYLNTLEPTASKRLFLDAITEIGRDNVTKPATEFIYSDEVLPNRFSNAQDFWGYYNGAENGQFLPLLNYYYHFNGSYTEVHPYTDITKDRTIDTLKSMAGILERIKYPTGGSTKFIYEHNRGIKGMDLNGLDLPDINPVHSKHAALSHLNHQAYDGDKYYSDPFTVTSAFGPIKFNVSLPYEYGTDQYGNPVDQNIACSDPTTADCRLSIYLEGLNGASNYYYIYAGEQEFEVEPGEYRIVFNPLDDYNWVAEPNGEISPNPFTVFLNWKDKEYDEDELLFTSGKRIKKIEQYDTNNELISFKEYDYVKPDGTPSGVVLSLASFASTRKFPSYGASGTPLSNGAVTFVEPYGSLPGSPLSTYQGNSIGYSDVTEYVGDKTNNVGKTEYSFTVYKDNGADFAYEMSVDNAGNPDSHTSFPYHPSNDFEWLRGMPKNIKYYKSEGNGIYKIVKSVKNEYMFGGQTLPLDDEAYPTIFSAPTLRVDLDEHMTDTNLMYDKNRTMFRMPIIHLYLAFDETPGLFDNEHWEYKIFHLTGGTLGQRYAIETLYDDNEQPTLVTESKTDFNYDNHYQPAAVTTATSDGQPVIQTMIYPQDLVSNYTIDPDTFSDDPITALAEQHRFLPLETKTYKDLNNDGYIGFPQSEEILSTTITEYDWFPTALHDLLKPSKVLTSKGNDDLEERIEFKKYDENGNLWEVSKTDGVNIAYIWGYNKTLPIAKLENADIESQGPGQQSAITGAISASNNDIDETSEDALRVALNNLRTAFPEAVVTSYTYDPLIGITSMIDPRGHTVYYEFDELYRLKRIYDEDGYLISENEYNYKITSGIENYIKNTTYLVETTDGINHALTGNPLTEDDKVEKITYFDGLGRGLQSITKQAGGQKQDIITSMGYDEFGRQLRDYLPYSRANSSLDFDVNLLPDANGNISALNMQYLNKYIDDLDNIHPNPYSQKVLEPSPLGRVMEQAAPGSDWAVGNGHTIKFGYETNTLNPSDPFDNVDNTYDNVIHFDVAHPNNDTEQTQLIYIGRYASNELYKTITKDENWTSGKDHTTEEFKNKQGQVVLKRTFNDNEPHDTYYVYDDFGNLTYVLPPTASDEILTSDPAGRVASQVNRPWVDLVNVDKTFAEDYNKKLSDYENADILNADIENAYGGQGGFTVTTLDNSEQVLLSINFSATEVLELKKGELVSLKAYGSHKDTELGRITGNGYSYTFYIKNNAIHVDGSGKLNGVNQIFNSNTKLTYNHDYLWTSLVDIDSKFATAHQKEVLDHAKQTGQDPLNVYLSNAYGGQGGLNITIDEDDNIAMSFNINSTSGLQLKQGVVINLDTKRRFENRYLGTLNTGNYSYNLELRDNSILITGGGIGQSFVGTLFPNPPGEGDLIIRTEVIEGLAYIYHYDYRNRLIEKKIPGKGWEHIVYDKLDRPILRQDAKQRIDNEWLFTKYDALGRVTYTGKHQFIAQGSDDNSGRLELQATANSQTLLYETKTATAQVINGSTVHYTNDAFPNAANIDLLTINYYDNYDNTHLDTSELIKQQGDMVFDEAIDTNAKLLTTTTHVRVLGTNDWITSVSYFDEDDMPIYVASKNEYLNTSDVVTTDYDFIGKTLTTESTHLKDSNTPIIIEDTFSYDHAARLVTQSQTINGSTAEQIVKNTYDEFGQLENKKVGGDVDAGGLQTVNYAYNIRGWLKSINDDSNADDDLFDFAINYNNPTQGTALYNGNISETFWTTANDNNERGYHYTYDALNRIKKANYHGNYALVGTTDIMENYSLVGDNNTEGITYDKNGNIISLRRMGLVAATNLIDVIDELNYDYDPLSNKLLNVGDNATEDGFKDGNATEENDYLYDINGNMIQDLNKNITAITYNHLNLPTKVTFSTGNALASDRIEYSYDATGVKLRKTVVDMSENNGVNNSSNTITDYAGGYIYEKAGNYTHNGQNWAGNELDHGLKFFSHPEGYVEPNTNNGFNYVYSYLDHLGNIRLSYKDNNGAIEILEENNYYPFGLKHEGYNDLVSANVNSVASKFEFQGVEFEEVLGLNLHEMDVRSYDAALGRFTGIDPVTHHSMSPYVAFDNNPIFWADPSGADATDPITETNRVISSRVDEHNVTHITQTTRTTTITTNEDGSVTVTYSSSSITNTVDANGEITNGSTVTTTSGTITKDADGKISATDPTTTTENIMTDSNSDLTEWTNTVSDYNKNNDGIYNKDKINELSEKTTNATRVGVAVLSIFGPLDDKVAKLLEKKLGKKGASAIGLVGVPTSLDGVTQSAGDALNKAIGENNGYMMIYGVEQVKNGATFKKMKTPSSPESIRKRVGPTSWQDLWEGIKSIFD